MVGVVDVVGMVTASLVNVVDVVDLVGVVGVVGQIDHCNFGRKKSYFLKKEKMPLQHMTLLTHETKEPSKAYSEDLQLDLKSCLTQFGFIDSKRIILNFLKNLNSFSKIN